MISLSDDDVQHEFDGEYLQMHTRMMDADDKLMQMMTQTIFVMPIDDVEKMRKTNQWICSEYFYGRKQPYKMRLRINPNNYSNNLAIDLLIYSSSIDADLEWPFVCDASIKIVNKASPDAHRIITNHQTISKPEINSYSCDINNAYFLFDCDDLSSLSLLSANQFIIQLFIDHK